MSLPEVLGRLVDTVPALAAVYLYGSEARGEARPDSDVDLALLARRAIPGETLLRVRQLLESSLGRDVDVVDLRIAPLTLVREVLADGRRLLAPDALEADLFEVRALRDYEDLKRRREPIETDIAARGRVFGP